VREHFLWSLSAGYTVTGLDRDVGTSRAFYVLTAAGGSLAAAA
jgi:hypothetical protein